MNREQAIEAVRVFTKTIETTNKNEMNVYELSSEFIKARKILGVKETTKLMDQFASEAPVCDK